MTSTERGHVTLIGRKPGYALTENGKTANFKTKKKTKNRGFRDNGPEDLHINHGN